MASTKAGKWTRVKIPIEVKKQIIEKREQGVSVNALAREFKRTSSTICSILKDKEKLKAITASKGVSRRSEKRSKVIDDVEKLLLMWISEKQTQGENITQNIIQEKAKRIFKDIVEDLPPSAASTSKNEMFKASNGWFEGFKKRTGILNPFRHGEGGSSPTKAANDGNATVNALKRTEADSSQHSKISNTAKDDTSQELTNTTAEPKMEPEENNSDEHLRDDSMENTNAQSTEDILAMLKAWEHVTEYVHKHHPYASMALQASDMYDTISISYFRTILAQRQKPFDH